MGGMMSNIDWTSVAVALTLRVFMPMMPTLPTGSFGAAP